MAESVAETFPYGMPIHESQLQYVHGTVKLELVPTSQMTWSTWKVAIWGMRTFSMSYRSLESAFEVQKSGSETGKGILESITTSQAGDQSPALVARTIPLSNTLQNVSSSTDGLQIVPHPNSGSTNTLQDSSTSTNGTISATPE
jgi:hypothetical protein